MKPFLWKTILVASVFSTSLSTVHAAQVSMSVDRIGRLLDTTFIDTGSIRAADEAGRVVAFRREFDLKQPPKSAKLNLFANSRYVLWVNGEYVTRGPCRFERAAPEYDTVEVGDRLRKGRNAMVVLVTGPLSNGKIQWAPLGLTAMLTAGKMRISTDRAWKWSDETRYRSAIADWPNVYDIADARAESGDWTRTDFDSSKWHEASPMTANPTPITVDAPVDGNERKWVINPFLGSSGRSSWFGNLTPRRTPLLRETVVTPTWDKAFPVTCLPGEGVSFKFPRLVLAYTRFEVEATAGSELELTYSRTRYTCREGSQSFMTSDTEAIYEGALRVRSGRVVFKRVHFVERLYPFDRLGSFQSDDALLNKLWTTCTRGLEVTSEDSYIDCTDRERVEWMDVDPPMFDVTRATMAGPPIRGRPAYADPRLLESMLRRTAYSLQPEGWVKAHTCSDRFDIHAKMEDRACDWIEGIRRYYESTGKPAVIREVWPAVVTQLNYFLARRSERGLVFGREWGVWGNPVGYQHCEGTILNAFIYKALVDAAFIGRKIGKLKEAEEFQSDGDRLRAAMNDILWDQSSGTYFAGYYDRAQAMAADPTRPLKLPVVNHLIVPTSNAALFVLDQGVVPENRRARVEAFLFAHPPRDNFIMQYYYFFKRAYAADTAAHDEDVLATLRSEWEDMAYSKYEATYEGLHSEGSSAHGYGMFPAYFLSAYVLGVRIDGAAKRSRILIEPRLADLRNASGTVVTELGLVHVDWKRDRDGYKFSVEGPPRAELRLRLPTGSSGSAQLDSVGIATGRRDGRWTEYRLAGGRHTGRWTTS